MSKILVTGGAGFVGSHLVDRLVKEGNRVIVVDNLSTGTKDNLNPRSNLIEMDICDPRVANVFRDENPDTVFHLAAKTDARESVNRPLEYAKINILGSMNVINGFIELGAVAGIKKKKFVFFSTGGVMYGQADTIPTPETYPAQPLCPYGWTKLAIENYLGYCAKVFGLDYAALRPSNIYGPRQNYGGESGAVAIFCENIVSRKAPFINGDGGQTRDYIYVSDVVDAAVLAMGKSGSNIYNIGTGKETDVNTLLTGIKKILRSDVRETNRPAPAGEHRRGCLDCRRAEKELGWRAARNLDMGLEATVAWYSGKLKER